MAVLGLNTPGNVYCFCPWLLRDSKAEKVVISSGLLWEECFSTYLVACDPRMRGMSKQSGHFRECGVYDRGGSFETWILYIAMMVG